MPAATTLLSGCMTVVDPGEVAVLDTLGAQADTISPPGFKMFLWPIWDITKIPVRTINLCVDMSLPSKEGLTIASQMSVLYSIDPERAPDVLREFGTGYERGFILPIFRSAVADITAQFAAKDMHSGKRAKIEDRIKDTMNKRIKGRGFRIDAVLIKSIQLPLGLGPVSALPDVPSPGVRVPPRR